MSGWVNHSRTELLYSGQKTTRHFITPPIRWKMSSDVRTTHANATLRYKTCTYRILPNRTLFYRTQQDKIIHCSFLIGLEITRSRIERNRIDNNTALLITKLLYTLHRWNVGSNVCGQLNTETFNIRQNRIWHCITTLLAFERWRNNRKTIHH